MIIIPDIFSPYIAGKEMARQANWDDRNQYNSVVSGELANLFNLATFSPRTNNVFDKEYATKLENLFATDTYDPRVQSTYDAAAIGRNQAQASNLATALQGAAFPGQLAYETAKSNVLENNAEPTANAAYNNWLTSLGLAMRTQAGIPGATQPQPQRNLGALTTTPPGTVVGRPVNTLTQTPNIVAGAIAPMTGSQNPNDINSIPIGNNTTDSRMIDAIPGITNKISTTPRGGVQPLGQNMTGFRDNSGQLWLIYNYGQPQQYRVRISESQ